MDEELLGGGFSTVVVRRGDTVRRTAAPCSATVQTYLAHLRRVGVDRVPAPGGFDEQGREVLAFVDGTVPWWPWPQVLRSDDGLRQVAGLLLELRAAAATFEDPTDAVWHAGPRRDPAHVVAHGDLGPWNTVWRDDRLVGLIDWDTAGPAPDGWDAAQAAWFFVPLRPATGYRAEEPCFSRDDVERRFSLWCDEVGADPEALLDLVEQVQAADRHRVRDWGGAGREPYATFLARGDLATLDEDAAWLDEFRGRRGRDR
ncbi:phosphotransferase [Kineococcus endophyticus]|uniref:Phosphotransferase n=1 Tax=Kineococcus endophyticus TaxID=1181883 RepID=A0ABV3PBW4_9ACTN